MLRHPPRLTVLLACAGVCLASLVCGACRPSPQPAPPSSPLRSPKDPRKAEAKRASCEPVHCRFAAAPSITPVRQEANPELLAWRSDASP